MKMLSKLEGWQSSWMSRDLPRDSEVVCLGTYDCWKLQQTQRTACDLALSKIVLQERTVLAMASPAKRRKKNDHKASPSTVRSLDQFFKKKTDSANDAVDGPTASKPPSSGDTAFAPNLTDEEIARRLQKQWDQEDRLRSDQLVTVPGGGSNDVSGAVPHDAVQSRPHPDSYEGPLPDGTTHSHSFTESLPRDGQPGTGCEHDKVSVGADAPETPAKEPGGQDASVSNQKTASLALQSTTSDEDTVTWAIPFDESPLSFQPSKYIPELQKHWAQHGGGASYALLTRCFVLVNSTQSRIKIVDTLVNFLRLIVEADPDSLLPAVSVETFSWQTHSSVAQ